MPLPNYSLPKSFLWDFTDVTGCLKNFAKNVECEKGGKNVKDESEIWEKDVKRVSSSPDNYNSRKTSFLKIPEKLRLWTNVASAVPLWKENWVQIW